MSRSSSRPTSAVTIGLGQTGSFTSGQADLVSGSLESSSSSLTRPYAGAGTVANGRPSGGFVGSGSQQFSQGGSQTISGSESESDAVTGWSEVDIVHALASELGNLERLTDSEITTHLMKRILQADAPGPLNTRLGLYNSLKGKMKEDAAAGIGVGLVSGSRPSSGAGRRPSRGSGSSAIGAFG